MPRPNPAAVFLVLVLFLISASAYPRSKTPMLMSLLSGKLTLYRLTIASTLCTLGLFSIWLMTADESTARAREFLRFGGRPPPPPPPTKFTNTIIPNSPNTHVISLPRRNDRREQMEVLQTALEVREWTFVDAVDMSSKDIDYMMGYAEHVRDTIPNDAFSWPDEIDEKSSGTNHDRLDIPDFHGYGVPKETSVPMTCTTENFNTHEYTEELPEWFELTRARVACWASHLNVIHRLANSLKDGEAGLILEDDVDMERDIRVELHALWPQLPEDWDMVVLGHCFSDESHFTPPIASLPNLPHTIHRSFVPKCSHAYALSRSGARRLLQHLTYAPFAYSRAYDQALEWLIASGRLKSYSVFPSIVVQMKVGLSDISNAKEIFWKDELRDGVLEGLLKDR